jgi:DNA-binding NarL/FixJ family response regulator
MLSGMSEGQLTASAVVAPASGPEPRWRHPSHGVPRLRALPGPGSEVKVSVFARDAVLRAGVTVQLRGQDGLKVLDDRGVVPDAVALVVADELDDEVIAAIRALRRGGCDRVVVVASTIARLQAEAALRAGVRGLLRRGDALPQHLADVLRSAATDAETVATTGPSLRQLLAPADPAGPAATSFGLTSRDVEVLRLVAEGESTAAIARRLAYSESTIKNTIHTIVRQMGARNRAHAVASAVRANVI